MERCLIPNSVSNSAGLAFSVFRQHIHVANPEIFIDLLVWSRSRYSFKYLFFSCL